VANTCLQLARVSPPAAHFLDVMDVTPRICLQQPKSNPTPRQNGQNSALAHKLLCGVEASIRIRLPFSK